MNLKLLIPAGLIALVVGLVVHLPAPVAAGWVQSQVPGLRLTGVSGSALEGRVQYVGMNDVTLEDVRWQWSPLALLWGQARATLRISTDTGSISGDLSQSLLGNTRIQNLTGGASIAWLASLGGYRFVPLDGLLELNGVTADLKNQKLSGASGQIQLGNANWLLMKPSVTFGNFSAAIAADDQNTGIEILDSDGPLRAEGNVALTADNAYTVNLRVRARAGAEERLRKLLTQLGRADAEGWYRITERGQL